MPTKEWFQENPKISAYISRDLYLILKRWMADRGIRKVSQALTEILEEHLGIDPKASQSSLLLDDLYTKRLEILEGKLKASLN